MKKLTYLTLAASGLLISSCSNEDLSNPGAGDSAIVTLNLSTPQIKSRAYSDGKTANDLYYAIYDVTNSTPDLINGLSKLGTSDADKDYIDLQKKVSLKLLTDHKYRVVLWAESSPNSNGASNPYKVTFGADGEPVLEVNYTNVACNNEYLDAFFGKIEFTVTGDVNLDVALTRPFAQINIGTNDYDDAKALGREVTGSTISVTAHSKMNLFTGEIDSSDTGTSVTFTEATPGIEEKFPVDGYKYLAMTYILVPQDQENVTVTFDYSSTYKQQTESGSHQRKVNNVPVRRNYRTNIYGQILTSNAELNVHIEPNYLKEDLEPSVLEMAASIGGTVVLEESVTLEDGNRINVVKDLVVNLNGNNVTGASDLDGVFTVTNGANLTLSGEGKVSVGDNDNDYAIAVWASGGNVTIEGGTYEGKGESALIYCELGEIYIKGGTFKMDEEGQRYTLNCYDKNYKAGTAKIIVTGGKFYNFDPSASNSENPQANFLAPGYKVVETDIYGTNKWYTVVPESVDVVVMSDADLANAIKENNSSIYVGSGNYGAFPSGMAEGASLICEEGTVFNGQSKFNNPTNTIENATFTYNEWYNAGTTAGVYKNCNFEGANGFRNAYAGEYTLFEDCAFSGKTYAAHYDSKATGVPNAKIVFKNCVLSGFNAMGAGVDELIYDGCIFISNPNNPAYNGGNFWGNTEFINCEFIFDGSCTYEWIDCKSTAKTYTFTGCKINGEALTLDETYFTTHTAKVKVTIDGVEGEI